MFSLFLWGKKLAGGRGPCFAIFADITLKVNYGLYWSPSPVVHNQLMRVTTTGSAFSWRSPLSFTWLTCLIGKPMPFSQNLTWEIFLGSRPSSVEQPLIQLHSSSSSSGACGSAPEAKLMAVGADLAVICCTGTCHRFVFVLWNWGLLLTLHMQRAADAHSRTQFISIIELDFLQNSRFQGAYTT